MHRSFSKEQRIQHLLSLQQHFNHNKIHKIFLISTDKHSQCNKKNKTWIHAGNDLFLPGVTWPRYHNTYLPAAYFVYFGGILHTDFTIVHTVEALYKEHMKNCIKLTLFHLCMTLSNMRSKLVSNNVNFDVGKQVLPGCKYESVVAHFKKKLFVSYFFQCSLHATSYAFIYLSLV